MGEVLMQPMGGGIGSDDVTAAKAHVLAGHNTVTTDSDDEVVEGTMPDRGQWQYGQSMAHVNGYYAMNQLPEGIIILMELIGHLRLEWKTLLLSGPRCGLTPILLVFPTQTLE